MSKKTNFGAALLLAAMALSVGGCKEAAQSVQEAGQAADSSQLRQTLAEMGATFHAYHDVNRKFPEDWDALIAFAREQGGNAEAFGQLRDAGLVVNGWGLSMRDITVGSSNYALAYMPEATEEGGLALHADGAVYRHTAADLQQSLQNQRDL